MTGGIWGAWQGTLEPGCCVTSSASEPRHQAFFTLAMVKFCLASLWYICGDLEALQHLWGHSAVCHSMQKWTWCTGLARRSGKPSRQADVLCPFVPISQDTCMIALICPDSIQPGVPMDFKCQTSVIQSSLMLTKSARELKQNLHRINGCAIDCMNRRTWHVYTWYMTCYIQYIYIYCNTVYCTCWQNTVRNKTTQTILF